MKNSDFHLELGSTAACTKRIMEATNGFGQRDAKGATKDCFLFGSFFSSKRSAEAVMDVGADMIGMVKTNTKGFCKNTIEKLTKDFPVGSYLVFKKKYVVTR